MTKSYADICIERANVATEGPWFQFSSAHEGEPCNYIESDNGCVTTVFTGFENAKFIAHARTDVPELAKRLKLACEIIKELYDELVEHYNRNNNRNKCPHCKIAFKYAEEVLKELERMPEEKCT